MTVQFDPNRPVTLTIDGAERHLTPGAIRAFRLLYAKPHEVVAHQALNAAIHATTYHPTSWGRVHPQECPATPSCGSQSLYDVISELRHVGLPITHCARRGYSFTPYAPPSNFEYYPAQDSHRRPANLEA